MATIQPPSRLAHDVASHSPSRDDCTFYTGPMPSPAPPLTRRHHSPSALSVWIVGLIVLGAAAWFLYLAGHQAIWDAGGGTPITYQVGYINTCNRCHTSQVQNVVNGTQYQGTVNTPSTPNFVVGGRYTGGILFAGDPDIETTVRNPWVDGWTLLAILGAVVLVVIERRQAKARVATSPASEPQSPPSSTARGSLFTPWRPPLNPARFSGAGLVTTPPPQSPALTLLEHIGAWALWLIVGCISGWVGYIAGSAVATALGHSGIWHVAVAGFSAGIIPAIVWIASTELGAYRSAFIWSLLAGALTIATTVAAASMLALALGDSTQVSNSLFPATAMGLLIGMVVGHILVPQPAPLKGFPSNSRRSSPRYRGNHRLTPFEATASVVVFLGMVIIVWAFGWLSIVLLPAVIVMWEEAGHIARVRAVTSAS